MKTVLFIATFLFSVTAFASNTNNQPANDSKGGNNIVAIAKGALKANCDNTNGNLQADVEVVSACFAGGFITKVTFYRTTPCPPNTFCIQMIETVGTVTLGCNNDVIDVSCGAASAY